MSSAADAYDWEGFVEALRETRSLTPLWKRPGFPSIHLYYKRMKTNPAFAAAVEPLQPRYGARGKVPEEAYQLALRRLWAGAKLRDVAYNDKEPTEGRPSRKEFARRRRDDPVFGAEVEQALRANGRTSVAYPQETWAWVIEQAAALRSIVAVSELPGAPRYISIRKNMDRDPVFRAAMLEHCELRTWTPVTEEDVERAVAAIEAGATLTELDHLPGMPGRKSVMKRVARSPDLLRRVRAHRPKYGTSPYSNSAFQFVLDQVRAGQSLSEVAGRDGLPGPSAIYSQRRRDPVFDAQLRSALEIYGRGFAVEDHFRTRLRKDRLYAAVDKVVRSTVAPFIWDEVRSEMLLAVLEGEIEEADISRETARAFAADYYRQAGTNKSRSIDATFGDSNRTLYDVIEA